MRHLHSAALAILLLLLAAPLVLAQDSDTHQPQDLKKLSIEELTQIPVTSVSRRPEPVARTAAAVSVITGEAVRRSAAVTLAEVLRLGDGVDVGRVTGSTWGVTTRGFNITTANKLLVLVDGRSTYSGLFGGTFWDAQDTFLADLDRIEVIRGPGGAIWGANAVNGVINIISKPAQETQGTSLSLIGGTNERAVVAARYGGAAAGGHYRVYGKYRMREAQLTPEGESDNGELQFGQGGFRFDSDQTRDVRWTVSGVAYAGSNGLPEGDDTRISGGHLLASWARRSGSSETLSVRAYYDRSHRMVPRQFEGSKHTGELDIQQQITRGRHLLIVGGTGRVSRANDRGITGFVFEPQVRTGWTLTGFLHDEITLAADRAYLIAGAKFGRNNFTGLELQPNLRFRYHPTARTMTWAAVSRAVRLPTRIDEDLRLVDPSTGRVLLTGSERFQPEAVVAYEAGYRIMPHARLSLDAAAFVNDYDRLRSQEGSPVVVLGNGLNARTHGIELAATFQPIDAWRLHGSYAWLRKSISTDPASADRTAGASEGNDPRHLVSARSYLDLPHDLALDAVFRFVGARPRPQVDAYAELDLRLGWRVQEDWELSLVGQNLLHERHAELFSPATPTMFPRAMFLRSIWTF